MANVITPLQRIPGIASDIYSPKNFIFGQIEPENDREQERKPKYLRHDNTWLNMITLKVLAYCVLSFHPSFSWSF
jgi:hypothetical protein